MKKTNADTRWERAKRAWLVCSIALASPKIVGAVASIGALIVGIWSYYQDVPAPAVAVLVLAAAAAIVWIWNGLRGPWTKEFSVTAASRVKWPITSSINKEEDERPFLVGEWCVRNLSFPDYVAVWEFLGEGVVRQTRKEGISAGRWKMEAHYVSVDWGNGAWDNFNRPLRRSVRGDSHAGRDAVYAFKRMA